MMLSCRKNPHYRLCKLQGNVIFLYIIIYLRYWLLIFTNFKTPHPLFLRPKNDLIYASIFMMKHALKGEILFYFSFILITLITKRFIHSLSSGYILRRLLLNDHNKWEKGKYEVYNENYFLNVFFFDVLLNDRIGWQGIHTNSRDTSLLHA